MKTLKITRAPIALIFLSAMIGLFLTSCSHNQNIRTSAEVNAPSGAAGTVQQSNLVIQDFLSKTGQVIPTNVLQRAAGIAVIPNLTKAAFIAGGSYGSGVLLSHRGNQWSPPVFMSIAGGSVGFQIGISETDLVMVFQNPSAFAKLEQGGKFNLGADVTIAAGPVGANADVSTINADVLAYRRTEGAFAGVSLSGDRVALDGQKTVDYYGGASPDVRAYYGQPAAFVGSVLNNRANLKNVPPEARALIQTLNRVSR